MIGQRRSQFFRLLRIGLITATPLLAQLPEPNGGPLQPGTLPDHWITGGPKCMEVPEFQIHEYNPDFYILRESGCVNYEKPFLYLLFGGDRALLLDTGAGETHISQVVSDLVAKWSQRNGREPIPLVVSHLHSHGDHTSGDPQFASLPNTTLVGPDVDAVKKFYGFTTFASEMVEYDLGDRVLDVIGIPGHDTASIAIYDRQTGILLTGDTVYPGRIYVRDPEVLKQSIHTLAEFARSHPIAYVLGTHIEQTSTPYLEYPIGSIYQPDEHTLQLSRANLFEFDEALRNMDEVIEYAMPSITIFPRSAQVTRKMNEVRQATESAQRARMWDQNASSPK